MNRKLRIFTSFGLLIFILASIGGCSSKAAEPLSGSPATAVSQSASSPVVQDSSYIVVDALDREIRFTQPPRRIVLTGRALFMVADALYLFPDAARQIAALAQTNQGTGNFVSLIDPDYEAKAILGKESGAEQIAPIQPDAVILKSALAETLGSSIEALGIPVVYVDFETPEQYSRDLIILGSLFQNEERAVEIASLYQERLQQVETALAGLEDSDKQQVLLLYASNKDGVTAFNVPPLGWMQTRMVELAGGVPVWTEANTGSGWTTVTLEQIATWDPDSIFLVSYQSDPSEVTSALKNDPNWQLLRALKEERLFAFAGDLYSWDQPDPRWILGLQWMAGKLYPERFIGQDMLGETRRFFEDFYGLDSTFFDEKIRPAFKGDLP